MISPTLSINFTNLQYTCNACIWHWHWFASLTYDIWHNYSSEFGISLLIHKLSSIWVGLFISCEGKELLGGSIMARVFVTRITFVSPSPKNVTFFNL